MTETVDAPRLMRNEPTHAAYRSRRTVAGNVDLPQGASMRAVLSPVRTAMLVARPAVIFAAALAIVAVSRTAARAAAACRATNNAESHSDYDVIEAFTARASQILEGGELCGNIPLLDQLSAVSRDLEVAMTQPGTAEAARLARAGLAMLDPEQRSRTF